MGQWALYWKRSAPPNGDGLKVLDWWDHMASFENLAPLAKEAELCLTQPITSSIAAGSFRALEGLLSSGRQGMADGTLQGHFLAMINGEACHRPGVGLAVNPPLTLESYLCVHWDPFLHFSFVPLWTTMLATGQGWCAPPPLLWGGVV